MSRSGEMCFHYLKHLHDSLSCLMCCCHNRTHPLRKGSNLWFLSSDIVAKRKAFQNNIILMKFYSMLGVSSFYESDVLTMKKMKELQFLDITSNFSEARNAIFSFILRSCNTELRKSEKFSWGKFRDNLKLHRCNLYNLTYLKQGSLNSRVGKILKR